MNDKYPIGHYLCNIRIIKGYSLKDIENLTNKEIDSIYLFEIESGKIKKPDNKTLITLSKIYNIDVSTLIKKAESSFTNENNKNLNTTYNFVDNPTCWKDLVKKK